MKKQLLYLSFLFTGVAANAQITLTTADVGTVGEILLRSIDTAYTLQPIGAGGTNMTWNYTNMTADKGSTFTFKDPSTMPDFAMYPTSNLGASVGTNADAYLKNTASSLTIVGQAGNVNGAHAAFTITPAEVLLTFPTTYGTNFGGTTIALAQFAYTAQTGVDSLRVKQTKTKQTNFDGWGSLTTPLGTYNVLRSVEAYHQIDSIWAHTPGFPPFVPAGWQFAQEQISDMHNYSFWANSQGYPVLEMDSTDATGNVDVTWNLPSAAGIPTVQNAGSFNVYPNPATTNATFDLKGSNVTRVEIYNAIGEMVLSTRVSADIINLSTEGLPNGAYYVRFFDANQANKGGSKFYIAK